MGMDIKTTLKMAAGAAALFSLGAIVTAVALGTVPIGISGGALSKAQVEQVVHDYLIAHPDIIIEMSNKLDGQQAAAEQKARDDALFDVGVNALLENPPPRQDAAKIGKPGKRARKPMTTEQTR